MNKQFLKALLLPALLLCFSGSAQSFEGKITYAICIESKLPNITSEQFSQMLGNRQDYYIKGNQYKTIANGAVMQWQLYVPGENKLYSKMSTTDVIYWNDAGENKDSILSSQIIHKEDTVLGYSCDKLVLNCAGGRQEYLFNKSAASADATFYSRHRLVNWYEILKQTGALPLRYTLDNPQFTLTGTAILITPEPLEDAMFALPAGAETQKAGIE